MDNIVEIYNNEPRAGTFLISQGFVLPHKSVVDLVRRFKSDFQDFSVLKTLKLKSTGGRAANEYLLDEDQVMFLGTLIRNSKVAVQFKKNIVLEFKRCRKELEALKVNSKCPVRMQARFAGKLVRLETTDTMKEFVDYARGQGSKSPDKYYMAITKMMNGLLFIVEGKHKVLRDVMSTTQLMTVSSAEHIIERSLSINMKKGLFYKDIFKTVKADVFTFAELHGQSHVIDDAMKLQITPQLEN